MHPTLAGAAAPKRITAQTRFPLYRALPRLAGPALAYRLTFSGRAAA